MASAIKKLDWIQDGIDETESEAIQDLLYIAMTSRSVVASIVSFSWVQDGIHDLEAGAFRWLNNIGSAEVASSVVSLGWVEDGIEEIEVKAIERISYIDYGDAKVASSVVSLGWVQDGIEDSEVDLIDALASITNGDAKVASSIVSLSWAKDGIEDSEVDLIDALASITNKDAGGALRIVRMPFLAEVEPADVSATESLARIANFREDAFEQVMAHPSLADGITDALTPIVAMLYGVAKTNPSLTVRLLDPEGVDLERRTITLPLTGDVDLVIVRTGPGSARGMDLLEHSVRASEELIGIPFPTRYVGLLYENAVSGGFAGTNFGTHIAILPKYDVDDGSYEAEFAPHAIAHEVAHYFWSGNADWVDEGVSDFMASSVENRRAGKTVGVTNDPCPYARSIAELEILAPNADADLDVFGCNYSLGERLFVDMARTLGDDVIWRSLRDLYAKSLVEDDADDLKGTSLDIDHLWEVIQSAPGAAVSIERWYDGTEDYDISQLDTGPVEPILASINGRIDEAYVAASWGGPAVSDFSAQDVTDWVYLTLKYSYDVSGDPREVHLEIVEYYEDGFEFRRRRGELTAEARYIGGTAGFSVGPTPSRKGAPGRYWVYVYAGERKVAEVKYEVTP